MTGCCGHEDLCDEVDDACKGYCEFCISRAIITHLAAQVLRISETRDEAAMHIDTIRKSLMDTVKDCWEETHEEEGAMIQ